MIPVERTPEPADFDAHVRQRGNAWLETHPDAPRRQFPDHWGEFRDELAQRAHYLCAYTAMWDLNGTVDHFASIDENRQLAYEWSNYRYATGWINSSKSTKKSHGILDPCDVGEGWFEIDLATLALQVTDRVPPDKRELAKATLKRLPIGDDRRIRERRRVYYEEYERGVSTLEELRRRAPLLAAAIEKQQALLQAQTGTSPAQTQAP